MHGLLFRFYVHEGHRHHGRLVWERLLTDAPSVSDFPESSG
ncbi:MAG: hypothetical protein ACREUL_07040 [Steroidobacteraceae bacterium]